MENSEAPARLKAHGYEKRVPTVDTVAATCRQEKYVEKMKLLLPYQK